jgi:hypothetical protein
MATHGISGKPSVSGVLKKPQRMAADGGDVQRLDHRTCLNGSPNRRSYRVLRRACQSAMAAPLRQR